MGKNSGMRIWGYCTVIQNFLKSGHNDWATSSSARSYSRTAHSFAYYVRTARFVLALFCAHSFVHPHAPELVGQWNIIAQFSKCPESLCTAGISEEFLAGGSAMNEKAQKSLIDPRRRQLVSSFVCLRRCLFFFWLMLICLFVDMSADGHWTSTRGGQVINETRHLQILRSVNWPMRSTFTFLGSKIGLLESSRHVDINGHDKHLKTNILFSHEDFFKVIQKADT